MKSMDKLTTGVAYGTSAGSAGYWFLQWLDQVSPSQWAAIGVLGSLALRRRFIMPVRRLLIFCHGWNIWMRSSVCCLTTGCRWERSIR